MGTRLYPSTQNVANLERLAGVLEGTHAKLLAVRARQEAELQGVAHHDRYELEHKHWQEVNDDLNLGNLDHFLTSGWGKFDPAGVAPDYAGELTDPAQIATLFEANGIKVPLDLCEGVHWC